MTKLSNPAMIIFLTKLLILLALAKVFSLGVWWYFPSDGVELNIQNNYQPKYQRVDFKNMITMEEIAENKQAEQDTNTGISITNMVLKGLYGTSSGGYVIVAMKANQKATSIIGLGEVFGGYTLKTILPASAIFQKLGKDYILSLEEIKKNASITKVKNNYETGEPRGVSRQDIAFYAKDPKQIWKDISIVEVKNGEKIVGFKVTAIKADSKFATLGLQKGDLIIRANNVNLQSYRDAIEIYKNINKLDTVQIVVLRDNQEMELVYEIH
ncbi:hypothetical protein KKG72_10345 [bacterium]|nr:hypothetical protein [bacterium]MBU1994450.1 hypothetical protein [bacterium]